MQIAASDRLGNAANGIKFTGGTLRTTGSVAAATRNIEVISSGTFDSNGFDSTVGTISGTGSFSKSGGGNLTATQVRVDSALNISGGQVSIAPNGTDAATSRVDTLSVNSALDLTDNKLIVTGQALAAVEALVVSGRNGGTWDGDGIVTSMSDAQPATLLTTLAVTTAGEADKTTFGGLSVAASEVLVMYTYDGDADLSGKIDGDDFFRIDTGYTGALTGYANGDFNYSGNIDADDYFIIDRNYARQGPAIDSAVTPGVAVVPEPTAIYLVAASLAALARRRRQRA